MMKDRVWYGGAANYAMEELDGKWPWETGETAEQPKPEPVALEIPFYTLPKRKARRGEEADKNGMRPLSARERARQLRGEDERYFTWR